MFVKENEILINLYDAVQLGDFESVIDLCSKFQQEDYDLALQKCKLAEVQKWIDRGIDINKRHSVQLISPLMVAVHEFDLEAVKKFLSMGANVNYRDSREHSALDYILKGYRELMNVSPVDKFSKRNDILIDIMQEILKYNPDFTLIKHKKHLINSFNNSRHMDDGTRSMAINLLNAYIENQKLNNCVDKMNAENQNMVLF